jgi:hypothetical protein
VEKTVFAQQNNFGIKKMKKNWLICIILFTGDITSKRADVVVVGVVNATKIVFFTDV